MAESPGAKRNPKCSSRQQKKIKTDVKEEAPVNPSEIVTNEDVKSDDFVVDLSHYTFPNSYVGTYLGPSNAEDPYLVKFMQGKGDPELIPFVTRAIRPVNEEVAFTVYERECECDDDILAVWNEKYKILERTVAPFKEQLIALFFRFIDWSYPAVDKKRFYSSYFHHKPPMNRGLMCAMLGLGTTYWKYSTQLCTKPIPPRLAADLWQMSLHSIEHDINCQGASLDTVTAILLYLQKRIAGEGIHEQVTSRIHVGKLVALAYSLGLHLDCTDWDISVTEKFARRRAWALVFYSEKWSAANMGHPSMLFYGDSEHRFDSQYAQERWFVQLVKVTNILSDTLNGLYTHGLYTQNTTENPHEVVTIAETLLSHLRQWWSTLSEDLTNIRAKNDMKYCSNGMLHLSALAVEVLIYRKLLTPTYGKQYRSQARDLVQRIIAFCLEITHSHLHAFWISTCRLSLSSLAHFVLRYHAQSSDNERKRNAPLMRSWLECLRSLSHGWEEGIGLAYHRMDALFYKGQTSLRLPLVDDTTEQYFTDLHRRTAMDGGFESNVNIADDGLTMIGNDIDEPLGLEEDLVPNFEERSPNVLFSGDNLHDLLYDLIGE